MKRILRVSLVYARQGRIVADETATKIVKPAQPLKMQDITGTKGKFTCP